MSLTPELLSENNESLLRRVSELEAERDFYKQQYEQLEERVHHINLLLENTPDFVGIADFDGTLRLLNRGARSMLSLDQDADVSQAKIQDFFYEEDLNFVRDTIMPAVRSEGRWQGEFRFRDMQTGLPMLVHHNVFVLKDADSGDPISLGTVARDISDRKAADELQQKLVAVIENSTDFIGIAGPDGKVIFVNEAGRQMMGFDSLEDEHAAWIQNYFMPEDLPIVNNEIMPVLMRDGNWQGEFRFRHSKTGEPIPVSYNLFVVRDQVSNEVIAIATVSRDISEQVRAEAERAALQEQVIEAQRLAIRELATPLIPLADGIVAMPLLGTIDTSRAQQIMETLLEGCAQLQAEVVILDITGVRVVDMQVADGLLRTARAASLLGSEVIITGIGPEVAQTLVQLGVDLSHIVTRSTLQNGILYALQKHKLGFAN
jgi:rsbT co-antagonist protein RsbR